MSSYILTSPIDIYLSGSQSQINLYNSAGTFAAQLVAPSTLTANIDFTLPSTNGSTGQYLRRMGASAIEWSNPSGLGLPIHFRTFQNSTTAKGVSTDLNLQAVGYMYFPGSINLGASPTNAYFVFSQSTTGNSIRTGISDLTNGGATVNLANYNTLPYAAGTLNLITLTLSNISTGPSAWVISIRKTGGTGTVSMHVFKILL